MKLFYFSFVLIGSMLLMVFDSSAQQNMTRYNHIPVIENGDTLAFPWAGGLNSPQFSHTYLNNDAYPDLVIFDRGYFATDRFKSGHKLMTFLNNGVAGEASFTYAPQYEQYFPLMNHWMLMRDFNCDGVMDIFTRMDTSINGIWYYEGYKSGGQPGFTFKGYLKDNLGFSLPSQVNDLPVIADINSDGDLDVLMFDELSKAVLVYYENRAIEGGGDCGDSLSFTVGAKCWGRFEESPLTNAIKFNQPCIILLEPDPTGDNGPGGGRHAEGTLVDLDVDGNGFTDLLLGDPSYPNMTLVVNSQVNTNALMVPPSDSLFPSYDTTIHAGNYPIAFHLDVDNDGEKDLVVSNNFTNRFQADDPVLFYKDINPNDSIHFNLRSRSFMQSDMIDLGFGAAPAFIDYNADGLMDLVIGNFSDKVDTTGFHGKLRLYLNEGCTEFPKFVLQDDNFLNIGGIRPAKKYYGLKPHFADLDGDNDKDLLVGESQGTILYFKNTAGAGNPAVFVLEEDSLGGIDVGQMSAPFVFDANGDQLPDLIVGRIAGNIWYFQNRGTTTAPLFDPVPNNYYLGQVDVFTGASAFDGHSTPVITRLDAAGTGPYYLISGNDDGRVAVYEFNPANLLSGAFAQVSNYYSGIETGERSALALADLTDDGALEMVVGSYRGGLQFYSLGSITTAPNPCYVGLQTIMTEPLVQLYPNPANNRLNIEWTDMPADNLYISITDLSGKALISKREVSGAGTGKTVLDISSLSGGVYICTLQAGAKKVNKKIIVIEE